MLIPTTPAMLAMHRIKAILVRARQLPDEDPVLVVRRLPFRMGIAFPRRISCSSDGL
jgi:hypothetical protein